MARTTFAIPSRVGRDQTFQQRRNRLLKRFKNRIEHDVFVERESIFYFAGNVYQIFKEYLNLFHTLCKQYRFTHAKIQHEFKEFESVIYQMVEQRTQVLKRKSILEQKKKMTPEAKHWDEIYRKMDVLQFSEYCEKQVESGSESTELHHTSESDVSHESLSLPKGDSHSEHSQTEEEDSYGSDSSDDENVVSLHKKIAQSFNLSDGSDSSEGEDDQEYLRGDDHNSSHSH